MSNRILILDDEPHLLDWLREYLESKTCEISITTNVSEAIAALNATTFRLLILDLNIPAPLGSLPVSEALYESFPGLYVADFARNMKGYRGRQVIVYSVHDQEEIRAFVARLSITYCVKGRPRRFKTELDSVLSFDPTQISKGKHR